MPELESLPEEVQARLEAQRITDDAALSTYLNLSQSAVEAAERFRTDFDVAWGDAARVVAALHKSGGSRDASLPQLADDQVQRFWRALSTTQINADGVLGLPLGVFFMGVRENGSRLMVRQAYTQLWDVAEDLLRSGCKRLVVRGTPGIGKSWWLFFVMHKAACAGVTVVLDSEDEQARFLFRGDIVMKVDLWNSFDQELADEKTWYLVDGRMPVVVKARTIAAVSPAREKYYRYSKAPGVEIRYMPLWSLEELERARQLVFPHISKEQVEKKYEVWGGTARYCLQFAASNLDAVLRGALARTDLKQLVSDMGALEVNEEVSNRLVHWSVFPDFTQKTTVFASEAIKKEVTDLLWKRGREEVLRELAFIMGRREYTSLAGALFETVTHDKICAGGEFLIRDLEQPGAAAVPMSFPRAKEVLFKDEREFKKNVLQEAGPCYCVPTSLTFAAVDALSPPRSLFQATIAERHPVKEAGLSDALKLLPEEDEYHLYFAVPEQRFADFKKQTITAVKNTTVQDMQPAKMNGKLKRVRQFALKIVARSALRVAPRALVV